MTVAELMKQIWEFSGELTTYDPYDGGEISAQSPGGQKLIQLLNQAQTAIVTWKNEARGMSRFFAWQRKFRQKFVVIDPLSEHVALEGSTLDSLNFTVPAESVGKFVRFIDTEEVRQIIAQTGAEAVLSGPLASNPVGRTFQIVVNYGEIPANERWLTISQVFLLPERVELDEVMNREYFLSEELGVGLPTRWYRSGRRVYVDAVPDDRLKFSLVVLEAPQTLSMLDQVPEIYEQFHYGLVLWATAQVMGAAQEPTMKYSYIKQFEDFMKSTQTQTDIDHADLVSQIGVDI